VSRSPEAAVAGGLPVETDSTRPLDTAWQRASRRELVILMVYFTAVVLGTDFFNVRLGVELLTLAVLIPAVFISRAFVQFVRDWWFFLIGLIMWNLSGPIAAESPLKDHPHLGFMLNLDHALFLGRDPVVVVQNAFAHRGSVGPLDVVCSIAYNLHLPEPYIAGYFLWRISRVVYLQYAAAVLILLVLGFISFVLFPAVPPWLAAEAYGKVPTVFNGFGAVLRWHPIPFHGTPLFYIFKFKGDTIAAFPSEHAAFPFLELLAFSRCTSWRVVSLLAIWNLFVLFTVVYLGEHWITDALAGYLYAILIFGFVLWFSGRKSRARVAHPAGATLAPPG
jgi:membrane-associated phospholipid phosphatase